MLSSRKSRVFRKESMGDDMSVRRLRRILEDALDQLDDFSDKDVVVTSPNTRGMSKYLCDPSYGFVDLENIEIGNNWDEED